MSERTADDLCGTGAVLRQYPPMPSFRCSTCESLFSNADTLEVHITVEHVDYLPYSCSRCSYVYLPTKYAVRVHFAERHSGEEPKTSVSVNMAKAHKLKRLLHESDGTMNIERRNRDVPQSSSVSQMRANRSVNSDEGFVSPPPLTVPFVNEITTDCHVTRHTEETAELSAVPPANTPEVRAPSQPMSVQDTLHVTPSSTVDSGSQPITGVATMQPDKSLVLTTIKREATHFVLCDNPQPKDTVTNRKDSAQRKPDETPEFANPAKRQKLSDSAPSHPSQLQADETPVDIHKQDTVTNPKNSAQRKPDEAPKVANQATRQKLSHSAPSHTSQLQAVETPVDIHKQGLMEERMSAEKAQRIYEARQKVVLKRDDAAAAKFQQKIDQILKRTAADSDAKPHWKRFEYNEQQWSMYTKTYNSKLPIRVRFDPEFVSVTPEIRAQAKSMRSQVTAGMSCTDIKKAGLVYVENFIAAVFGIPVHTKAYVLNTKPTTSRKYQNSIETFCNTQPLPLNVALMHFWKEYELLKLYDKGVVLEALVGVVDKFGSRLRWASGSLVKNTKAKK